MPQNGKGKKQRRKGAYEGEEEAPRDEQIRQRRCAEQGADSGEELVEAREVGDDGDQDG